MIAELLAGGLGKTVDSVLGRFFEDKDQAAEAAHELRTAMLQHEADALAAARDVVVAEAQAEHWITAAWRPLTMLVFAAIIANNYILAPYLDAITGAGVVLEPPEQLWELLKIGLGGYVVGRSGEKMVKQWKGKG